MRECESEFRGERLYIDVVSLREGIETLRPAWSKWETGLEADIDFYLHQIRSGPTVVRPYIITASAAGILQAMLVGYIQNTRITSVLSFVRIPGPNATVLKIVNGGRIGKESAAIDALFARQLAAALQSGRIDLLRFERLSQRSELLEQLSQLRNLIFEKPAANACTGSVLSLISRDSEPPSVLCGKSMREIRRKTRNLERAFPNGIRFKRFRGLENIDVGIRDAIAVALTSWQYPLGYGLVNSAQVRDRFRISAKQGWFQIYLLYINEFPCAFLIGHHYKNAFQCDYAGFNPTFAHFSVGSLLTSWALERLASEGVQHVELGEGNREYNRRLGCKTSDYLSLDVCAPTSRGLLLKTYLTAVRLARNLLHTPLFGLDPNRIGKIWRHFLIGVLARRQLGMRRQPSRLGKGFRDEEALSIVPSQVHWRAH